MLNRNLQVILLSTAMILFLTGCATKNQTILKIENDKKTRIAEKINIFETKDNLYAAYINSKDKIQFICSNSMACDYNDGKIPLNLYGLHKEEIFYINKQGYQSIIPKNSRDIECGYGTYFGFWSLLRLINHKSPFENYHEKNSFICKSKYSKVDSYDIGTRIFSAIPTLGTSLITAGSRHTKKFDTEAFIQSLATSKIEFFRKKLILATEKYAINGGFDIIYLEKNDIEDSLEDKYFELLDSQTKKAGVVFLDIDTNEFLSLIVFDKYKNEMLVKAISSQINDIIKDLHKDSSFYLTNEDIESYIPDQIALPKLPKIPELKKSEFEKIAEFKARVELAVIQREEKIRKIQRQYDLDVFERNAYIDNLQKGFEDYLNHKSIEQNRWEEEIKKNVGILSKVLLLENISSYNAKNFNYDAEEEKLYFTITSFTRNFQQKVFAKMDPINARSIKEDQAYKIIPQIDFTNGYLQLTSFIIEDTQNNDSFEVSYTNKYYSPNTLKIFISNENEKIHSALSTTFKKYKQENKKIQDSNVTIGYQDVVSKVNAKVPHWFISPTTVGKSIAYGENVKRSAALATAREELAYMVKVKINTTLENTRETNDFKKFSQIKQESKQSSDIELKSGDYRVYKQEKLDGRWYVALELLNKD